MGQKGKSVIVLHLNSTFEAVGKFVKQDEKTILISAISKRMVELILFLFLNQK